MHQIERPLIKNQYLAYFCISTIEKFVLVSIGRVIFAILIYPVESTG